MTKTVATPQASPVERFLDRLQPHIHWVVRVGMAAIFLFHGIDKLTAGTPPAEPLDAMFLGSPLVFWLVATGETAAALGFMVGGFNHRFSGVVTRTAGAVIVVIMAGAVQFHVSGAGGMGTHPWHFMQGGAEFQVLTGLVALAALLRGRL